MDFKKSLVYVLIFELFLMMSLLIVNVNIIDSVTFSISFLIVCFIPGFLFLDCFKLSLKDNLLLSIPISMSLILFWFSFTNFLSFLNFFFKFILFFILILIIHFLKGGKMVNKPLTKNFFIVIISSFMLLLLIFFFSRPFNGLNDDCTVHTLLARLILEQNTIYYKPSVNFIDFWYPPGFHLFPALLSLFSNIPVYNTVIYFGLIILSMIPLSVYFFFSKYGNDKTAMLTMLFSLTYYMYFAPLGWGGLAQITSIYFFNICLGSLISFYHKNKMIPILLIFSLVFIHIQEVVPLFLFSIVLSFLKGKKIIFKIILIFFFSFILLSILMFPYFIPNMGTHISATPPINTISFHDFLIILNEWVWPQFVNHNFISCFLVFYGLLTIIKNKDKNSIPIIIILFLVFLLFINESIIGYAFPFRNFLFPLIQLERITYLLILPFSYLAAKGFSVIKSKNNLINIILIIMIISIPLNRTLVNVSTLFNLYNPVSENDRLAFDFIDSNISKSGFVNDIANDGGLWINSYTDSNTLYVQGTSLRDDYLERLALYERLVNGVLDKETDALMDQFNMSYIYVGDKSLSGREKKLSASLLLKSDRTHIVFSSGNVFILSYNSSLDYSEYIFDVGGVGDERFIINGFYNKEFWAGNSSESFRWCNGQCYLYLTKLKGEMTIKVRSDITIDGVNIKDDDDKLYFDLDSGWNNITFNYSGGGELIVETDTFRVNTDSRVFGVAIDTIKLKVVSND